MNEIVRLSAATLADHIRTGELSSAEVVDAHLERIREVNPQLNAIIYVLEESARLQAKAADTVRRSGEPLGPLHGVPFTVKLNIDVAGQATTWGVPALLGQIAPEDAPVVERMKGAGAIVIGRTNLPDVALRVHTDSSAHGLTNNPWNRRHTCGGSSGGEAVSLASGMSPVGLGNDIGGSLRNPATCCGIASIRPSKGMVPSAATTIPGQGLYAVESMNVQGPMARRVADVRLALSILSGSHRRDPDSVPRVPPTPLDRPLRIALLPEPPGGTTDPEVAATTRLAGRRLEAHGHRVEEAIPPLYAEALAVWSGIMVGSFGPSLDMMWPILGEDTKTFLDPFYQASKLFDLPTFSACIAQQRSIGEAWSNFFATFDVIVSPTWARLPFEVGADLTDPGLVGETFRSVQPANLLGLPSACVPVTTVPAVGGELPVGVQITGPRYSDYLCLDVAEQLEAAEPARTPIDPRPSS